MHDPLMFTEMDRKIALLAARQGSVFSLEQALGVGFTYRQAMDRVGSGAWVRLAAGAYAIPGAVLTVKSRVRLATLVIAGAVASHESAGELHDFPLVRRGLVVVSRPDTRPNRSELGRIRRLCDFRTSEHSIVDGIPATSRLRTAGDLAAVMRVDRYQRMVDSLLVRKDFRAEDLAGFAVRWCRRGRKGSRLLWRTVDSRGAGYVAPESALEAAGLKLLAEGGFPPPVRQLALPWRRDLPGRVDCAYPGDRVLIEWDSRKHHLVEEQFEVDRHRDAEAVAHGWAPLRFTWKMIHREQEWVWRMVRGARSRSSPNSAHPLR